MMERIFSGFSQHFSINKEPYVLKIYSKSGLLPEGFNVGVVDLDGSEHSSLKWDIERAHIYPRVFWEIDFALSHEVLNDEARYLSLEIACKHFTKVVWPRFEKQTYGVILYRGPFIEDFIAPLKSLAAHLPQSVHPFILLDTENIASERDYFRKINLYALGSITPILKGKWAEKYPYAFPALGWDHGCSPLGFFSTVLHTPLKQKRLSRGVLLPQEGSFPLPPNPFRMIPEQILTHEWEGMNQLLVDSSSVSDRCKRKLLGFSAAGGEVINYQDDGA